MSALTDQLSEHAIAVECQHLRLDRVLALVQDHLVIATFPGHQEAAAFDLARVLCRALAQPIDLFRLGGEDANGVRAGLVATAVLPRWTHLAQVRPSLFSQVDIEICDPHLRMAPEV